MTGATAGAGLFAAVRGGYGGLLASAPLAMVGLVGQDQVSPRTLAVVRVLGVRQLLQAALSAGAPPPVARLRAGAAIDVAHCASMIGLAIGDRALRRAARTEAVIAASLAACGLLIASRAAAQARLSTAVTAVTAVPAVKTGVPVTA